MKRNLRLRACYALIQHKLKCLKIEYFSLLAVLTSMCLYAVKQVSAQQAEPAATAVTDIKPLQIGDTIPDALWGLPLQVVNHPQGKDTITLNDYRDKLLVVDFWGTYCKACLLSLPALDSLQGQFRDDIQILLSSTEKAASAGAYLSRKGFNLPSVVEGSLLSAYFPHLYQPYDVWIMGGKVVGTTQPAEVNAQNIAQVLMGDYTVLSQRIDDLDYNFNKPLLIDGNGKSSVGVIGHSVLTGYLDRSLSLSRFVHDEYTNQDKVIITNASIYDLYTFAMIRINPVLRQRNRVLFETTKQTLIDSKSSPLYNTDSRAAYYSYELVLPNADMQTLSQYMLDDLNRYFSHLCGIRVNIEKRKVTAWVLERLADECCEIGGQLHFKTFVNRFRHVNKLSEKPIVDLTGIDHAIDMALPDDLSDFAAVRKALNRCGIGLSEKEIELDMLVFKDVPTLKP